MKPWHPTPTIHLRCANLLPSYHRLQRPRTWLSSAMVLSFILIQNRQGKTRLAKWYAPYTDEEKVKLKGEVYYSPSIALSSVVERTFLALSYS